MPEEETPQTSIPVPFSAFRNLGGAYPEPPPAPAPTRSKIFLVHGHNNEATYELARFLEKEEKLM